MDRQNKIIGIVGRKGSGKSTIFNYLLKSNPRLFIFNTMGEHDWTVDHITDINALPMYMEQVKDPKEKFQAEFTPTGDILDQFDIVADEVYTTGNMTFGIEELPMLTKSAGYMQPSLGRLFRLGRHQALNIVWTAQRAAEVPRGVTGATDYFILFQQTEPGDIKALEYRCGAESAEQVQQLGLHNFLTFDVVTREIGDEKNFLDTDSEILLTSVCLSDNKQNVKHNAWRQVPHEA